jgi:hypothetical protein
MAAWVTHLMSHEVGHDVRRLIDHFVERRARPQNGWEMRFARKFGLVYAAIRIGIEARLLPWTRAFAMKVVAKCYRAAWFAAMSDVTPSDRGIALDSLAKFDRVINRDGRLVDAKRDARGKSTANFDPKTVGVRFSKQGRVKLGIRDQALRRLFKEHRVRTLLTQLLADLGIADRGHGHAGTTQEHITITDQGRVIPKPRLWVLDLDRYAEIASRKLGGSRGRIEFRGSRSSRRCG